MNANEMTITAKLSAKLKNANQPKQKVTPQKHYEELDELYLESVVGGNADLSSSTISSPSSSTITESTPSQRKRKSFWYYWFLGWLEI